MAQKLKFGNGTWATKKGSTLSYNDEGGNFKPLPFTTTRDSIATRVNKEGLIEVVGNDVPRIDYTDSADGVLLLENSATNLITHSEEATNWSTQSSSVLATSNQAISPDGTLNADKLIPASGSVTSNGGRFISFSSTASTDYSISVFVKQGEYRYATFSYGSNAAYGFHFDLQDGVIIQELSNAQYTAISREVESFSNGWYRLKISLTDTLSTVGRYVSVRPANELPTATNNNYATTGDGTSGIYVWGLQLEQSSYHTSYIPTNGSTVTRVADTASGAGNSEVFNDSEGVLFADIAALNNDGTTRRFSISDGSYSNRITLELDESSNTLKAFIISANTTYYSPSKVLSDITNYNKTAIKYKQNDFSLWINGFEFDVDNSGNTPINLSKMQFADGNGSDAPFRGKTKEIGYYDTALTDEELEYLTSYRSLNELVTELNLNEL